MERNAGRLVCEFRSAFVIWIEMIRLSLRLRNDGLLKASGRRCGKQLYNDEAIRAAR
jgi:hypothetical protein